MCAARLRGRLILASCPDCSPSMLGHPSLAALAQGDDAHQARAWVSGALTDYEFWSGIIYLRHNRLVGSVVEAIGNKYSPARLDPLCCRLRSHVPEQPATPRATL